MLGYIEIDYIIRSLADGRVKEYRVRGVQVGRFAVRHAIPGEGPGIAGRSDEDDERFVWRVDHIPTGFSVATFETADDAHAFADDISRFSASDPASRDPKRAGKQIGRVVGRWAKDARESNRYTPFREWVEQQGEQWSPRGRLWRKL